MIVETLLNRCCPLDVACISDAVVLKALRPEWEALEPSARYTSVFSSWLWSDAWWKVFLGAQAGSLRVLVCRDPSGTLVGIAPLYRFSGYARGGVQVTGSELLPVGYGGRRQEGLTEEPSLLAVCGSESDVLRAVTETLLQMPSSEWDYARFALQHNPDVVGAPDLTGCRSRANIRRVVREGSARRLLPADWQTLRKSLSRSMRDNTSYYPRLLKRHGHDLTLRRADRPEAVLESVPTLVSLHRRRAEPGAAGTPHLDHLPGPLQEAFLSEVLPRLAESGSAYVLIAEVSGEPIAAQAFFVHQGVLTFYYSGFDSAWHTYSPLLILAQAALEDAMARGLASVDMLPKPALWKSRWGAEPAGGIEEVRINRITPPALFRSARLVVIRHLSPRSALL